MIRYRNKEGKVSEHPSMTHTGCRRIGRTRDDIILDKDGVKAVLARYFQQQYGHEKSPEVNITFLSDDFEEEMDMLVEIEFNETEYPIF